MERRHIAFFNTPATGHLTPTLGVVEELVRRGHRVTYAATEDFAAAVAATGATVLPYESTVEPRRGIAPGAEDWMARCLFGGLREGMAVAPVFDAHFSDDPPDLVAYDGFVRFMGEILASRWKRPGVIFYPAAIFGQSITPAEVGNEEKFDQLRTELQRFAAMNDVAGPSFLHQLTGDPRALKIFFLPPEFRYPGDPLDDGHVYVGPSFREQDFQGEWRPPESGHPVVLISLGTSFNEQPEFFRTCAEAFADQPWHVVLALGPDVDPAELGSMPANVEVHGWVPMQAVLEHARVHVCHGGVGTVMHSLYAGTPLIAVSQAGPSDLLADQVRAFGVGRTLRPSEITGERVLEEVAELAADDAVRRNVLEMSRRLHEAGGARRAADEILAHLERNR